MCDNSGMKQLIALGIATITVFYTLQKTVATTETTLQSHVPVLAIAINMNIFLIFNC